MIVDQFRDNRYANDAEELRIRSRMFLQTALMMHDTTIARYWFARSAAFARKAHELENNQRRLGK